MQAQPFEHYIKYMGSKTKLMDHVVEKIEAIYEGGGVCDLFAGSCSLSGALGREVKMFSNDIQSYSAILAETYLKSYRGSTISGEEIVQRARATVAELRAEVPEYVAGSFYDNPSLNDFVASEKRSRSLMDYEFSGTHHLFTKNYSGTWWSIEQCLWIDALKKECDALSELPEAALIQAALMYAMAYCSQGTGHYAQYRDAKDASSLKDILIYRRRSLTEYFIRKFDQATAVLPPAPPILNHEITALDYRDRLATLPSCTVYADPPYCFVHYSRFYHAIETLALYDYPDIQERGGEMVKGRYREERHQSPFSIRSQVSDAFRAICEGVAQSQSKLVLSYANTGMISLEDLLALMREHLPSYKIEYREIDYAHMTMGRKGDRTRDVRECLITAQ